MRERNRDRTRESRRSSMAPSTNGFPKRRHRTIVLRDSYDDRAVELRESLSKKGRNGDRDKDSSNRSKRRRGSSSYRDEGEQSTDESVGNDQDDDVQFAGVSRIRSPNTTSSVSDQNHRRSLMPAKPPPFKITSEVIGVAVPRKARSASVKRSHESLVYATGGGGGGDKQNFRQQSNSPGGRSVEPALPSSNASARKKKAIGDVPKTLKSSSSDIEIEIAELLYGLRASTNHESSSQKLDASVDHHTSSTDAGKKKVEDYNYATEELVRVQHKQPADVDCHDGNATSHENGVSDVPKVDIGEYNGNSGAGFGGASGELQSCSKLDADKLDSASTRVMSAVPEANTQRAGKFEIDLMALPPMVLSPKGDDLSRGDFTSESKPLALDVEMKREDNMKVENKEERLVKIEKIPEAIEKAKMEEQDRNKEEPTSSSNPKVEKIDVSGQPSSASPIGSITMIGRNKPPLQKVVKTDKTTGSSTTPRHVNFVHSQPQPKRCATHCYIARNILRQQFKKMSPLMPETIGSGSLCGTKPVNVNRVPAAENMVVSKQSQKYSPFVHQNGAQKKGLAAKCDLSLTATRSSNNANPSDSTHRMQFVLQQGPHPGSTGNLVHGPAFLFPQAQHQASVVAATTQAGIVNSPSNTNIRSQSSVSGSLCTSSTLPPAATAVNFSYPNFAANDSPYMTLVHNNGYSFPFSTASLGANAAIKGASPAQGTNILSGSFYSSQIFHPLQHQQQHPHSQALVQPSYLNANTLSSSSSHRKSQGAQFNGNSILTSTTTEQQTQKRQTPQSHPHKQDTEIGGENVPSIANSISHSQKNLHKQNFTIPVQPVNFSFKPPATSDTVGGNSGKFGDKQQQQQPLKGGVDIIPSQAFAISFTGFNGTNIPSNLNFSSMAQNPSLPGIAWQGSQAASVPHTTQQKTCSITGEKSGGNSSHQDDEKKTTHCKSSTSGPTTLVFDNSSKNINFMLSAPNGNWPSHSTASTVITSMPFYSNASSSQQSSQLLQLQKQHGMQQQQLAMATRNKASSNNSTSATKFANNDPVFSQSLAQCKSSNQASHSKTTGRNSGSHIDHTSIVTSKTPTIKGFSQEKGRVSQGHMQISFGGNYITSLPPQGHQPLNNNQPLCTTDTGTPFGGNLKPNSEGKQVGTLVNTSLLQQSENSSGGSGQKSSPVCGRNVPSILSSGPGHLSELKY